MAQTEAPSAPACTERKAAGSLDMEVQPLKANEEGVDADALKKAEVVKPHTSAWLRPEALVTMVLIAVTLISYPYTGGIRSWHYVWWCGWLTAVSTGFGAVPFLWVKDIEKFWLGVCNALAAGMMLAATSCLFYEAFHVQSKDDDVLSVNVRLLLGVLFGIVFIKTTKIILDEHEDVKVCGLDGLDAQKALLIMAVMTLHSISEGIGVGVSFGGEGGDRRGLLVSLTLAIHNIPEGLAICLVLIPRGLKLLPATVWCILSSMPQPLFAVPSFLFVETFLPILPAGLGFAGGAMAFVAICELLPESLEDTESKLATSISLLLAFTTMLNIQYVLTGEL
ncbi:hypothetical protein SPRG_04944 [Saprolegnia parasitica CBS 223.65]|uniref:Uncharacterized protein n=1 Tax=Saprolegnia parasitica (strain CBS 223.65) TaxID=695850 RepID=A0A067CSV2_SAPPC|nr:hypothetical protein SPRG_04944 [Saprolegnia parasitica CBS 223.65]KDO29877.1 hypothetical protein SPRG_04944 [Saprolegnia parasitica CBS 223.65]|eukprot:XP_012199472.1 hypothetical protein SPRG_04944 [Saprolegnia parasitica CBS 223.65]